MNNNSDWLCKWTFVCSAFISQLRHVTNVTGSYVTPNGHNLSDMHAQSILILLSETQAPSHCSAIQSHVTCFSLIAGLTCQISLAASREDSKAIRAYLWCSIVQVLNRRDWHYEDKASDFTFENSEMIVRVPLCKFKVMMKTVVIVMLIMTCLTWAIPSNQHTVIKSNYNWVVNLNSF